MRAAPTTCLLAALAASAALAQVAAVPGGTGPDRPEPGSAARIAVETTEARFSSSWVAWVPESESVPSPRDVLGRDAGAAGELTRTDRIHAYFRALAAASPRVRTEVLGATEEGREILLAVIADEEGMARLDELKAATAALADPRRTDPERAEAIVARARPIYYVNAGLHADETGGPEMVMELAYRLAVSESEMIRRIRSRVVVLINPVANPDGRDKMVDWFYRHLKGRTRYAELPRQSPPYWGRYVFVDANRDAHQQAQALTRAVFRMFFDYHPTVIHDLHEAIPLLQTWNGTGPYNPHLDPIVTSQFLEMSFHEVTALSALGMPGVWTWDFGEGFGHHYLDSIAMNHNAVGRGYETFGNATAETVEREISADEASRTWYRPWPPPRRFRWSLRNHVNYAQTALLAILDYTARHADELLRNFYRTGYNSWRRGVEGDPSAIVIPATRADRLQVAELVNLLRRQGIEVHRSGAEVALPEGSVRRGDFVVRLDQPYRNYAVDLLLPQRYPRDASQIPYDDVSWALPVHYGVEAWRVDGRALLQAPLERLREPARPRGRVAGEGPLFLLRDTGQEALLAARYRLREARVEIAEEPFRAGGVDYPAGSWIVTPGAGGAAAVRATAEELALDFESAAEAPRVARHGAPAPRIGIWVPWADTDSIGWIRYVLDRQGVPWVYLRDEELRAGDLRDRVDVIVYGNVDLDLQGQIHGIPAAGGPLAFTRTAEYPSHGEPAASEDVTGGPGWSGLSNLQQFVAAGGVLVTLGNGSTLALEGGLVRSVRRARGPEVLTPGVELRARFARPDHPLAYGYPRSPTVFRQNYPVYDLPRRWLRMAYCTACLDGPVDTRWLVLEWGGPPEAGPMVVSGGARNEEALRGRPAILAVPVGRGRIVVYNFNPLHRDLNRSDHRLLWNALLNWQHL